MRSNDLPSPARHDFNWIPVFFLRLHSDGTILQSNPYTERLFGKDPQGLHFRDIIVDFNQSIDPNRLAKENIEHLLVNVSTFSGLPLSLYATFRKEDSTVLVVAAPDAREEEVMRSQIAGLNQKLGNAARDVQKANAELERLNKLKTQFLGMAAHDLRKPVGVVMSFSEIILEQAEDSLSEEHRDFLRRIIRNARFMSRLIDDFLDVSMIESGTFQLKRADTPIQQVVDNVEEIVSVFARRKGVLLDLELEPGLGNADIDGQKVEQVLINTISNAIEHSTPGALVNLRVHRKDQSLCFEVEDRGVGIPEDKLQHLFDPYRRGFSQKTGNEPSSGLGLAISKKIVETHGGTMVLESVENEGTCVRFELPA